MTQHNAWFEAIGLIGACLTTFSFLPQAIRIWRTRSARDVSLVMYVMMTTGSVMWLIYGLLIGSPALIVSNGVGVVMVGSVLALKLQDMLRPRNLLVEIVEHEAVAVVADPVNTNDVLPTKVPPAAA
ncbi:MAG TPA: SemiSWEET transporter [Dongiaceae bacterium]|jgi:MtN3 and saliva related transmembrane protein|nr:SemiSWEET transporter [Dongiaceae bacterium]